MKQHSVAPKATNTQLVAIILGSIAIGLLALRLMISDFSGQFRSYLKSASTNAIYADFLLSAGG